MECEFGFVRSSTQLYDQTRLGTVKITLACRILSIKRDIRHKTLSKVMCEVHIAIILPEREATFRVSGSERALGYSESGGVIRIAHNLE